MRNFVLLYISIIGLSFSSSTTSASELNAEIEAIMKAVIQAHEAEVDRLRQSRGSATVSIVSSGPGKGTKIKENMQVKFYFKGQSRRSDIYSTSSEMADRSLLRSRVDNGEFYYSYNPVLNSASVDRSGSAAFKGDLAEDFHHDVFFNWVSNIPLRQTFQRIIDKKVTFDFKKIEFTDDNLLKLTGSSNEKKKYDDQIMDKIETFTLVLDPRHSYRIVKYHYEQKNVNGPGSSNIDDLTVDWQGQHLREQYPRYVKYDHFSVLSETTEPPEGVEEFQREIERHLEINVEEFESGIDIDDTVFTLKGMGVRNDTKIDDIIAGVFYTYGSMKVSEASLESLLNDSKSPEHSSVATATDQNQSSKEESSSDDLSMEDTRSVVAKGTTDSGWNIIAIVISLAVITIGAFFLLRLIASKRKPN